MPELASMRNIGKEMARKLTSVGIDSPEKLMESGAEQAYFKLKVAYPQVCLVHLYVLEGAIRQVEFNQLPAERQRSWETKTSSRESFLTGLFYRDGYKPGGRKQRLKSGLWDLKKSIIWDSKRPAAPQRAGGKG